MVGVGRGDPPQAINFWFDPIPDTDSRSIFHFSHHSGIGDFRRFTCITISHSHRPIFTLLGGMAHAEKRI